MSLQWCSIHYPFYLGIQATLQHACLRLRSVFTKMIRFLPEFWNSDFPLQILVPKWRRENNKPTPSSTELMLFISPQQRKHSHTHTQTHSHTNTFAHTHKHSHTQTHIHTRTHTQTHTHSHTHKHGQEHTHKHTRTNTLTTTHTNAHAQTHTQTHSHTLTQHTQIAKIELRNNWPVSYNSPLASIIRRSASASLASLILPACCAQLRAREIWPEFRQFALNTKLTTIIWYFPWFRAYCTKNTERNNKDPFPPRGIRFLPEFWNSNSDSYSNWQLV